MFSNINLLKKISKTHPIWFIVNTSWLDPTYRKEKPIHYIRGIQETHWIYLFTTITELRNPKNDIKGQN